MMNEETCYHPTILYVYVYSFVYFSVLDFFPIFFGFFPLQIKQSESTKKPRYLMTFGWVELFGHFFIYQDTFMGKLILPGMTEVDEKSSDQRHHLPPFNFDLFSLSDCVLHPSLRIAMSQSYFSGLGVVVGSLVMGEGSGLDLWTTWKI